MGFKLTVAEMIGVKVEGTLKDEGGNDKPFNFVLVCKRLSQDEMKATFADKDEPILAFFERNARDWHGQQLVLADDNKPAPYTADALRVLLSISGMGAVCWQAYVAQVSATAKN
jgi:hypothetical protein